MVGSVLAKEVLDGTFDYKAENADEMPMSHSNSHDKKINHHLESKFSKKNTSKMKVYDTEIQEFFGKKNKKSDKYKVE